MFKSCKKYFVQCIILLISIFFIAGCASYSETTEDVLTKTDVQIKPQYEEKFTSSITSSIEEDETGDYGVGPRDSLSFAVYGEEDLSLDGLIVSQEGYISFPLTGRVHVEGLTTPEIEKKIAGLLANGYIVNPQVTVSVKSFKSKKAFILGAVEKPGVYPLRGQERLLEIISTAGGIENEKAGKFILIWRQKSRGKNGRLIKIGMERLLQQGDMNLNVPLINKDVVFVPQAEYVYIIGEVKKPGSYKLYEKDISILEAITMAGGFTPIASPNKTRVIRVEEGEERTIFVRMKDIIKGEKSKDIILKSGDIVVVPESLF
ncbi:MAG: polysaccharide biosynthesis/export protein [Desulfobacteraceae bacterium Eth-SRB1]|nr:MAG: polysaccharide biosynthesis/export protein [Desulfobacteraceae bacterium Eth-SRB1]